MYFKLAEALENLLASKFWTFKQVTFFSRFFRVTILGGEGGGGGGDVQMTCISRIAILLNNSSGCLLLLQNDNHQKESIHPVLRHMLSKREDLCHRTWSYGAFENIKPSNSFTMRLSFDWSSFSTMTHTQLPLGLRLSRRAKGLRF